MKPLRAAAGVNLMMAILIGSGCSTAWTTQGTSAVRASESIDGHDRGRLSTNRVSNQSLSGNPSESSFGTAQPDGTFCGVFCSENH